MANPFRNRNYPWSLYAVFQTTITQWAFLYDCGLVVLFYLAMLEAGYHGEAEFHAEKRDRILLWSLFLGHMVFSKTIKLVPHLLRNPGDVRFVPISILFGYFHNLIKLYGCITVTEVILHLFPLFALDSNADGRCRRHGAHERAPTRTTTSG